MRSAFVTVTVTLCDALYFVGLYIYFVGLYFVEPDSIARIERDRRLGVRATPSLEGGAAAFRLPL